MTKFVIKDIPEGINVSKDSQLKNFITLIAGSIAVLVFLYFVLGLSIQWFAQKIPFSMEVKARSFFTSVDKFSNPKNAKLEQKLKQLSHELWEPYDQNRNVSIKIGVLESEHVNAYNLPGAQILLTSEFLKKTQSENALAFTICHELGHMYYRHTLSLFGRQVATALFLSLLGDTVGEVFSWGMNFTELSFSRDHERLADKFALDCLNRKYGHVKDFDHLFQSLKSKEEKSKIGMFVKSYMSTHPLSQKRIDDLRKLAMDDNVLLEGLLTAKWKEIGE